MEEKKRVFISYSTQNSDVVESTFNYLQSRGISCWMAPKEIRTGENFAEEITEGLLNADVFLLMFSKESEASEYVYKEVETAFYQKKPIIAFNLDGSVPGSGDGEGFASKIRGLSSSNSSNNMGFFLRNTQWLSAAPNPEEHFGQLYEDVSRILSDVDSGSYRPPAAAKVENGGYDAPSQGFFAKYKLLILALVVILIAGAGFMAYSGMGSDSGDDLNQTGIEIDYIGVADDGESYFVYGTIDAGLNDTSGYEVQTDFLDASGSVLESNRTDFNGVEDNTICQSIVEGNVSKVSVKLLDKDNDVVYSNESENIIK